jgi:methionyl-tRNA synthetase
MPNTEHPIEKRRIIVTSALPYVNNIPHLGTLVCVISANVYSRYLKLKGEDVISVLGTDEHGTTAETKALEEGLTPRQLVDKYFAIHKEIYDWFGCRFDCFGRTSSQANHTTTIEIFNALYKNGYILEQEIEQLYCPNCQKFLADRFIEGICPFCEFPDARGDQCDSCGKLINPSELVQPRCKVCGGTPEARKTKHLFIDLPKLGEKLEAWMTKAEDNWSQNARTMAEAWLKEGLKPRAITRDLKWGIPVPLKGYENKVFYSWFDAPIGYISITRENRPDWETYWKNKNTRLVQFMGKDNIPFHTILFPAFLIGADQGYTLVDSLSVNEYINYEGGKFSKSRNIGVFGDGAIASGITADAWRYYLMVNRPENADTEFIWKDFQEKINKELVANIGNFVNRTLSFIDRFYNGIIPGRDDPSATDERGRLFQCAVNEKTATITQLLDDIQLKDALREIMMLSRLGNQYFQESEPWKNIKENPHQAEQAIYELANLVRQLAILASPFMPETSAQIMVQLWLSPDSGDNSKAISLNLLNTKLKPGHKIGKPEPLFKKLEDKEVALLQSKYGGKQAKEGALGKAASGTGKATTSTDKANSEISAAVEGSDFLLDLKVGQILSAEPHPNADKLLVMKVNIGQEERQIVAGLRKYYQPEQLVGKKVAIVSNLMYANLRGMESQGMMLAADDGNTVKAIFLDKSSPGEQVKPEGYTVTSQTISIDRFREIQITVQNKKVVFKGKVLRSETEELSIDIADNATVR